MPVVTNGHSRLGSTMPIPAGSGRSRPRARRWTVRVPLVEITSPDEAQFLGQLQRRRAVGDERVRAVLDQQPIGPLGVHLAAEPFGGLDEQDLRRLAGAADGLPGCGQPGDPAADDQQPHRPPLGT